MIALASTAAFVGLVHSLSPGHWLPVVMVAKARGWGPRAAFLGALVASCGHILLSLVIAGVAIRLGAFFLADHEETIERYSYLALVAFGLAYSFFAWRTHRRCRTHSHHGPELASQGSPYWFLFSIGLSPCVAALPVFAAAGIKGTLAVAASMLAFAAGVVAALGGASWLAVSGVSRLHFDHPVFEHFGDVLTGFGVAGLGAALLAFG